MIDLCESRKCLTNNRRAKVDYRYYVAFQLRQIDSAISRCTLQFYKKFFT